MDRILFLPTIRRPGIRQVCRRFGAAAACLAWATFALRGGPAAANFDVHGTSAARAAAIVQHAENVRERACVTLLGVDAPAPWTVRCEIHLHATEESFSAAVGGPPDGARGATAIEFAGPDVCVRRIDLMDDDPTAVPDALAHELVHVVLADHFTAGPPPRWADEGLAVLDGRLDLTRLAARPRAAGRWPRAWHAGWPRPYPVIKGAIGPRARTGRNGRLGAVARARRHGRRCRPTTSTMTAKNWRW